MGKDKEKDGLSSVPHFKAKHSCGAMCVFGSNFLALCGSRLHIYNTITQEHIKDIKVGHDVCALNFNPDDNRLIMGLTDGTIKEAVLDVEDPSRTSETLGQWNKHHAANIVTLQREGDVMYTGAADGSLAVWDVRTHNVTQEKEKVKKVKTAVSMFFPDRNAVLLSLPDKILLLPLDTLREEECATLTGVQGGHVKAVTGFSSSMGMRIFLGCNDGSITMYDVANLEGHIGPSRILQKLHVKSIKCLLMFGHYLIATAEDKIVSIWNGKEEASQPNLMRKLQHKGVVPVCCIQGGPNDDSGALFCFDDTNRKVYYFIMKDHMPGMIRGHRAQMTFDVDPGLGESNPSIPSGQADSEVLAAIDAALSPIPESNFTSQASLGGSCQKMLRLEDGSDTERFQRLRFKDFYAGSGSLQSLFDQASEWIANSDIKGRVVSVSTVPVIGSDDPADALFTHSIAQSVYLATLRKKPEAAVPVLQVVRVVYWD